MDLRTLNVPSVILALAVAFPADACDRREPTRETWPGPHDFSTAPADNELWREGDPGEPLILNLRVLDTCGEPVPGAHVRILHADQDGEHHHDRFRAHLQSDARGVLNVLTVYPGYAGSIARHIHFIVEHPGHRQLVTRLFFKNDPAVDAHELEDLAMVLDRTEYQGKVRWIAGYEFVLQPNPE